MTPHPLLPPHSRSRLAIPITPMAAALEAIRVPDVPNLPPSVSGLPQGSGRLDSMSKPTEFLVIGHRGNGMNSAASAAFSSPIKENSIRSFNEASRSNVAYVEFDVQVTSDGHPVIFHDIFILSREGDDISDAISERRVTDLSLQEFRAYGPQREENMSGKKLVRKTHDGRIAEWLVEDDAPHCTLEEAFFGVADRRLGFNIELKFDDDVAYEDRELVRALGAILATVEEHAGGRPVMFSTFQPDAARLVRRLQSQHPVFFLTDGGTEIYSDARRNSLEEAVRLCSECGLQGVVSEVRAVLRNPWVLSRAREMGVCLLTYGEMNNVAEIVRVQHLMGIDGVIVDRVREITYAVSEFVGDRASGGDDERPMFSQQQQENVSFLLKPMVGY